MLIALLLLACSGADPSDSGDIGPTSGEFTTLTYNVHGLPPSVSDHPTDAADRMPQISPRLGAYDLIGIQEDFSDDLHNALVADAPHPLQVRFNEKVEEGRAYGSGLTLLSQIGLDGGYRGEHYTDCNGFLDGSSDCFASKGFQVQTLLLGGQAVDVYNTHHEAGGGDEDNAARASQVQQVIDAMATESAGHAIIYVGDFNLRPSDPPDDPLIAAYEEAGLRQACKEVDCDEPDHIDKIYVRDSATLRLSVRSWANVSADFQDADSIDLSDHPPITATLAWTTE